MSGYWTSIPNAVRKSKSLSAEEKELWYEIADRKNAGGYCTASNTELAKALNVSEKTITTRLSNLIQKRFANVTQNVHRHQRRIYLHCPGDHLEPQKPEGKELEEKTRNLQEALKKSIVFGTIDFNVLIEKLIESPYLGEVTDNSTQFVLTNDQMEFLVNFKKRYPSKLIDCQIAYFPLIDYSKLLKSIEESLFMQGNDNLSLKWCLSHAEDIMSGKYKTNLANSQEAKRNFSGRKYDPGIINSLFQGVDDIEI